MTNIPADALSLPTTEPNPRIDRDLYCVRCEYNLRTLASDALCPECAFPVADTLRDEIDPLRKRLLRRYAGLYLLGYAITLVPSLLFVVGFMAYRLGGVDTLFWIMQWPNTIARWVSAGLISIAILQLTRQRMLARGGRQYSGHRWILRLGAFYTVLFQFVGWWLIHLMIGPQSGAYRFIYAGTSLIHASLLLLLIGYLWRLLIPCPEQIVRRFKVWVVLGIAQPLIHLAIVIIDSIWNLSLLGPITNTPFPSVVDLIQIGMSIFYWAVVIVGIIALIAIRGHLAESYRRTHILEPSPVISDLRSE